MSTGVPGKGPTAGRGVRATGGPGGHAAQQWRLAPLCPSLGHLSTGSALSLAPRYRRAAQGCLGFTCGMWRGHTAAPAPRNGNRSSAAPALPEWPPPSDLLLSCFLSDSPAASPQRPGPLSHRLFLSGVFRLCHCHRNHPLQQMAGPESEAFLLSAPPQP